MRVVCTLGKEDCGMIFFALAIGLSLLILVALIRALLGPTTADRVVGVDTANTLMVSVMLVLAALFKESVLVDVAVVYAMLSFVGTLFFAKYLEGSK